MDSKQDLPNKSILSNTYARIDWKSVLWWDKGKKENDNLIILEP
jgi:hypothetical protein